MAITLTVLRCPDRVAPETRRLDGGELIMGRGPGAAWILPDASERPQMSRRHCTVFYQGGAWKITDQSTNGTYVNRDAEPVGTGERTLADGDRIRVGPYEIEVGINEREAFGGQSDGGMAFDPFGGGSRAPEPPPQQFGSQQFGNQGFGNPRGPLGQSPFGGSPSIQLPDDFASELLDPQHAPPPTHYAQVDHTPSFSDAFQAPTPRNVLPTDWGEDLLAPGPAPAPAPAPVPALAPVPVAAPPPVFAPPPAPPSPPPFFAPAPVVAAPPPVFAPAPAVAPPTSPFGPGPDFGETPFAPPLPPPPAPPAIAEPLFAAPPPPPPPVPQPLPPQAPAPVPAAAKAAADDSALLAAFLRGAQFEDAPVTDAAHTMELAGQTFRAFVGGLREVLIARAEVKGAFRIEQTMVRAKGNNPLKFAAGDDDAMAALLHAGRRTDMSSAAAVAEALGDIRTHELATMAAMQEAVRELIGKLDPAAIRAQAEQGGIALGVQRRAKAFDIFEAEFGKLEEALTERFDDVFGRAFAHAYEKVAADLQAKGRR